ncbi:hypothetical protein BD414DRAFT_537585 [Trametes punicea]|nr:hypothetical protein BD414DRAFT_537585 [Trametes punicea]
MGSRRFDALQRSLQTIYRYSTTPCLSTSSNSPVSDGALSFDSPVSNTQGGRCWSISTLKPEKLTPNDFLDLADIDESVDVVVNLEDGTQVPNPRPAPGQPARHFPLNPKRWFQDGRFPHTARGFLYFHRHPYVLPISGEVRFRVTGAPDPMLFRSGADLWSDYHDWPVSIPLLNILQDPQSVIFRRLFQDGLIPTGALDLASQLPNRFCVLTEFRQPFHVDLIRAHPAFVFVGKSSVVRVPPKPIAWNPDHPHLVERWPVMQRKGTMLCCFEKSVLPEHAGRRVVVCRVQRISLPRPFRTPQAKSRRLKEGEVHIPTPGSLLRWPFSPNNSMVADEHERNRREEGEVGDEGEMPSWEADPRPVWAVDVDAPQRNASQLAKGLRILYDNEAHAQARGQP